MAVEARDAPAGFRHHQDTAAPAKSSSPAKAAGAPTRQEVLPRPLRVAVGWSASLLVLGAALLVLFRLLARIAPVTLAVVAAVLLTALLQPVAAGLRRLHVPAALAALGAVLTLLAVLGAAGLLIWNRASAQLPDLGDRIADAIDRVRGFLVDGPLSLDPGQVDRLRADLVARLQDVLPSPYAGASTAAEVLGGIVLSVALLFLLLEDGALIWRWLVRLFPARTRERVDRAGRHGWHSLTGYVRGTVLVAAVDAAGIGLALVLLGVPLALPLTVLTFLGAFVPLIGATLAGAAAVMVALVTEGTTDALLMLAAVLVVQQIEGNLLQPYVMSRALRLHPFVILVAVASATLLAGVVGAIVAVPLVAVTHRVASSLLGGDAEEASR
jgi:predicted PurR-regulated permease PerM